RRPPGSPLSWPARSARSRSGRVRRSRSRPRRGAPRRRSWASGSSRLQSVAQPVAVSGFRLIGIQDLTGFARVAAVSFYSWMLALHLLAAFAAASALVLFSVLVFSGRRMTSLEETRLLFRVGAIGGPLVGAGLGLALVFGIILALKSSEFEI